MPKTVSNSSILIHLGKIGLVELLQEQFGEIWIPEAVWREVVIEGADEDDAKIISKTNWIHIKKVKNSPLLKSLLFLLDEGEAEAIALAIEIKADLILLDESDARQAAENLGFKKTGVIGILLKARKESRILNLRFYLDKLRDTGFYMSEQLYQKILQAIGES